MSVKQLFTTPVGEYAWDKDPQIIHNLKQQIIDKKFNFPQNDSFEMLEFTKWILDNTERYAYEVDRRKGYIILRDMWYRNMTDNSSFIPPHTHPSVWCIGTFYFDDGQGDLVLLDPRGSHEFEYKEVTDIDGHKHSNCLDYYHKPKANSSIMFPSYVKHFVAPTKNQNRSRLAISWNIIYNPQDTLVKIFNPPNHLYRKL